MNLNIGSRDRSRAGRGGAHVSGAFNPLEQSRCNASRIGRRRRAARPRKAGLRSAGMSRGEAGGRGLLRPRARVGHRAAWLQLRRRPARAPGAAPASVVHLFTRSRPSHPTPTTSRCAAAAAHSHTRHMTHAHAHAHAHAPPMHLHMHLIRVPNWSQRLRVIDTISRMLTQAELSSNHYST